MQRARTRWSLRWKNCGRLACCLRDCRSWCCCMSARALPWSRRCWWNLLGWKRRMPCLRCAGLLSTRWKLSSCISVQDEGKHSQDQQSRP